MSSRWIQSPTVRHLSDGRLGLDIYHAQAPEIHIHGAHGAEQLVLSVEISLFTDKVRFRACHQELVSHRHALVRAPIDGDEIGVAAVTRCSACSGAIDVDVVRHGVARDDTRAIHVVFSGRGGLRLRRRHSGESTRTIPKLIHRYNIASVH